ncbi:hypothetical protein AVEN_197211-1 [Araneus ventricosus]|uniref:Uncharacterized protein n=1 Tax=Araneus ventricosus TaxID=182803 RepID=A0A4Y2GJG9_ARAVE|nr:hypothetical protein AVEN_197211-1 [Araneus ventricosus]
MVDSASGLICKQKSSRALFFLWVTGVTPLAMTLPLRNMCFAGNVPRINTERCSRCCPQLHAGGACRPVERLNTHPVASRTGSQMLISSGIAIHLTFRSKPSTS